MATVDEEFRRQYRDVAPFNPTSKDRAHNTQQFIIFLQKMSQVQPLLRVLVKATKPTFATPRTGDYDSYVGSLEEDQCAIFDSHLLYLVSSKTGGVAQQLASIELLEHNSAKRAFFELIERYTQCKDGGAATLRMLQNMRWRDHPSPDRLYVAIRTAANVYKDQNNGMPAGPAVINGAFISALSPAHGNAPETFSTIHGSLATSGDANDDNGLKLLRERHPLGYHSPVSSSSLT